MDQILFIITGFFVGLLVGLTGVGGGSLMTPLLIFGFGVKPVVAVGTDLVFAAITKVTGIWIHWRKDNIDWRVAGLMVLGSFPSSLLTVYLMSQIDLDTPLMNLLVKEGLGVALVLTSLALVFRRRMNRIGRNLKAGIPGYHNGWRNIATVFAGIFLGILVTISSVGGGALGVAMLAFMYPAFSTRRIVGTDLAYAVPLTLVAGMGHMKMGTVDYHLLVAILLGSMPGIWLGGHLTSFFPEHFMRPLLASILMLIGLRFFLS